MKKFEQIKVWVLAHRNELDVALLATVVVASSALFLTMKLDQKRDKNFIKVWVDDPEAKKAWDIGTVPFRYVAKWKDENHISILTLTLEEEI